MADVNLDTTLLDISYESTKDTEARMIEQEFDDGYIQDAPAGINAAVPSWTISFVNHTTAQVAAVDAALESALNSGVRLLWTPPNEVTQLKWRVPKTWSRKFHSYNVESLSFTLRRAF